MTESMNSYELSKKIGLSENTTRVILCRQEFNKYVTCHKSKVGYTRIRYKIGFGFLDTLLEILMTKKMGKQAEKVRRWKNEYIGVL